MSSSPQPRSPQKVRFDVYELDARAGELLKHGYRVPLEDRPFRALQILLQHAPEMVTREELQKQLWPADVFIDFDHGLNKAIGKVRRALSDSADSPRFIETVGRRGYRFVASISPANGQDLSLVPPPSTSESPETRSRRGRLLLLAGGLVVVALLLAFLFRPAMPRLQVSSFSQVTRSGEAWPLEPMATDGPRLYYQGLFASVSSVSWRLKQVLLNGNEDTVVPGTSDRVHSFRIRGLSPDDTEFLALSRVEGQQWLVVTLPVVGGTPRRLGNLVADDVAWSHDGSALAYSQGRQLFLCNPDG